MGGLFIGLMSGTSMDGIDAAVVDLSGPQPALRHALCHPYPEELRARLQAVVAPGWRGSLADLLRLDHDIGLAFADAAEALLTETGHPPVTAIGSHGQTVAHHPESPIANSWQLGDPSLIAERTGLPVVADWRRRDLAAGGQGAPLAPAFHAATLRQPGVDCAVLNLGGIANLTLLPGDPQRPVTGFDTGPANTLLDAWSRAVRGTAPDVDGAWAASGTPRPDLLAALLDDPYFRRPPPKSTGREHFHLGWLQRRLATLPRAPDPADVQATLVALTVRSVLDALRATLPDCRRLHVCGGGVHNRHLMDRLRAAAAPMEVASTAARGIHPDHLEAMAFAWLAWRTLHGLPGNLPEVTGAGGARVLGAIYPGRHGFPPLT